MAKAEQLKALIKSYLADNDKEKFKVLSLQIAAYEARKGHLALANEIKEIIDKSQKDNKKVIQFTPDLSDLLLLTKSKGYLKELIVSNDLNLKINRILKEYNNREKLYKHGLSNRRKLLLVGAPGTGKTMTASVIATELGLPLYTVQMDKLINKYMGETGAKLRQIFDIIKNKHGVFLFDEFDAIGSERTTENEVGEMRRVLNSFLQFIENDESESLILAATNNISLLDQALFRRFDDILDYNKPDEKQINILLKNKLAGFKKDFKVISVAKCAMGLSHADITRACVDAIKDIILNDMDKITKDNLCKFLNDRKGVYSS